MAAEVSQHTRRHMRRLACFSLQDSCVAGGDAGVFSMKKSAIAKVDGFYFFQDTEEIREMNLDFVFFLNSVLLGVGLAMDAFSVSLANGMNEPQMRRRRVFFIAGIFGGFQAAMPLFGWALVHFAVEKFMNFRKFVPWIALILLLWIGGKMIAEGIRDRKKTGESEPQEEKKPGLHILLVQGIATSIDALSVGFTIAEYNFAAALIAAGMIAAVTFVICVAGVLLGRKFGAWLSWRASILGGAILAAIGIEIFFKGIVSL